MAAGMKDTSGPTMIFAEVHDWVEDRGASGSGNKEKLTKEETDKVGGRLREVWCGYSPWCTLRRCWSEHEFLGQQRTSWSRVVPRQGGTFWSMTFFQELVLNILAMSALVLVCTKAVCVFC